MPLRSWPSRVVTACLVATVVPPCSTFAAPRAAEDAGLYAHHGADWGSGQCGSRGRQSPVNINDRNKPPRDTVFYHYKGTSESVLSMLARNGTLAVEPVEGQEFGGLYYNGGFFPLTRISIHGPSEHTINGVRWPLELQLAHGNMTTAGQAMIISLLVGSSESLARAEMPAASDPSGNVAFQSFQAEPMPGAGGSTKLSGTLDLAGLLKSALPSQEPRLTEEYFLYPGSLSMPPCTEGVTWLLRRSPLLASPALVESISSALLSLTDGAGSYREVMPLGTRSEPDVVELQPAEPAPPAPPRWGYPPTKAPLGLGPWPRTDAEVRAERLAHEAASKAEAVGTLAKDLLNHAKESEVVWAAGLADAGTSFLQRLPPALEARRT